MTSSLVYFRSATTPQVDRQVYWLPRLHSLHLYSGNKRMHLAQMTDGNCGNDCGEIILMSFPYLKAKNAIPSDMLSIHSRIIVITSN